MITSVYLDAATVAASLIGSPEVAARWTEPSALAEMPVSGLAGHLARQIVGIPERLQQVSPGLEPITLLDHYARAQWVGAPLDAEVNVRIRDDSEAEAAAGPAQLTQRTLEAIAQLRAILPAEDGSQPYYLPWTGWSLTLDDFLTTRLLEIVIHVDDLAVSVDLAPQLPEAATGAVITLLAQLAARRHGPTAVLRALSRAERAPATITAF